MHRLLAIDYGEKRIGLALTDPMLMFAKPFEMIPNLTFENTLAHLQKIIAEKTVGRIIVGIPWGVEGNATAKTMETQAFMDRLTASLDIPVEGSDERYTTSEANELLKEMGYDWKKARNVIDSLSACLILKRYLERHPCDQETN
jgi:putative Holliday junction resolvase